MKTSKAIFSTLMFTVPLATTIVPSALNLNLNFATSYTVTLDEGTSIYVIWVALPTSVTKGKDFEATYILAESTKIIDEENSSIKVGEKDIRNESGVEWKDEKIKIPSSLVTANITIKLVTVDVTKYSVTKDSLTSQDISITLPSEIVRGESINVPYQITQADRYLDWSNSDITVNSLSIKGNEDVEFKDGNVVIPTSYIDGPVVVKLVTCGPNYLITDLSDVIAACTLFEATDRTDITTFLSKLKVTNKDTLVKLTDLHGVLIQFMINGNLHCAKIIDTQHDTITGATTDVKTAALTFDMVTLLSDSDGKTMTSKWDASSADDYTNSILRANLSGQGTGSKTFTKTALEMLPAELQSGIKTVTKEVAISSASNAFSVTNYDDKLFPLTSREMNLGSESAAQEGDFYTYWSDHPESEYKIKKSVKADDSPFYWLASPNIYDSTWFYVDENGVLNNSSVSVDFGVSFAFCI